MKLLTWLIGLMALLFYVAWPGYTGYRLKTAVEAGDPAGLEAGIDFPSVRTGLRPVVQGKVEESLQAALKSAGPGGAILVEQLRKDMLPKLVDGALDSLVTPQMLIKLHHEGRSLKEGIEGVVKDRPELVGQIGGLLGGLLGKVGGKTGAAGAGGTAGGTGATAAGGTSKAKPIGLNNIKSVSFAGPFQVSVGFARDPAAKEADVTATMSFTGGGWKVTELIPKL